MYSWKAIYVDNLVINIPMKGYHIVFIHHPPLTSVQLESSLPALEALRIAILKQVEALLQNSAIEQVKSLYSPGFYNSYSVVLKKEKKNKW